MAVDARYGIGRHKRDAAFLGLVTLVLLRLGNDDVY